MQRLSSFFARNLTFRQLLTLCLLAVAAIAYFAGDTRGSGETPEPAQNAPLPVETLVVRQVESIETERTYTGVLKASRASALSFERSGRLEEVLVADGQRVEAGDLLARLDTRNLLAQQRRLEAERAAAQALLDELEKGPRSQTIEASRARVRQLKAEWKLAQEEFGRADELLQRRAVSRSGHDAARFGEEAAEARFKAAEQVLLELEAGTRKERVAAQKAVVAQLDASLENLAVDLDESELKAPYAGRIAERRLDEGVVVSPGESLFRIVEDGDLEAWIGLPAKAAARMQAGDQHAVFVDGVDYAASVVGVLPELDAATRTRSVVFRLGAAAGQLSPSQVARVRLHDRQAARGFWVPTASLVRGDRGLWVAYVAEREDAAKTAKVAARTVELLHTQGSQSLVTGTMQDGDEVIASGAHRIAPGMRVAPVPIVNEHIAK